MAVIKGPAKALILDFSNVLCSWKPPSNVAVPPQLLRMIMSSDIWQDYECGRYSREECYAKVADRFHISAADMEDTLSQARKSLQIHHETLLFVQKVKKEAGGELMVCGMTNTPQPEEDIMHSINVQYPVFDRIFISGNMGMRKPSICFYQRVMDDIGLPADAIMFIDDRLENVIAAQSVGIRGIRFQSQQELRRDILNFLGDPVSRGLRFLAANAKKMHSVTSTGDTIQDNFAQLLILELTQDRDLVSLEAGERTWNYFIGPPKLTTDTFPDDMDTTSMALSVLPIAEDVVSSVLDDMLKFVTDDGIFMTYFDSSRPRVDPVVCINVLGVFCRHNRERDVLPTFHWILNILVNRAYLSGTRYYPSPDVFLYFLARLSRTIRDTTLRDQLVFPLIDRLRERRGAPGDAVSLGARILACHSFGIACPRDLDALRGMQCEDGGWPVEWVYRFASFGLNVGNRGLATAFAVKALESPCGTSAVKATGRVA